MVLSADAGRLRARCDNWVRDVTGVLREHIETFWMWPGADRTSRVTATR